MSAPMIFGAIVLLVWTKVVFSEAKSVRKERARFEREKADEFFKFKRITGITVLFKNGETATIDDAKTYELYDDYIIVNNEEHKPVVYLDRRQVDLMKIEREDN